MESMEAEAAEHNGRRSRTRAAARPASYSTKRLTKTEAIIECLGLRSEGQTLGKIHSYLQGQVHRLHATSLTWEHDVEAGIDVELARPNPRITKLLCTESDSAIYKLTSDVTPEDVARNSAAQEARRSRQLAPSQPTAPRTAARVAHAGRGGVPAPTTATSAPASLRFAMHSQVDVKFGSSSNEAWHRGTVARAADGSYDVKFSDGEVQRWLDESLLRLSAPTPLLPATAPAATIRQELTVLRESIQLARAKRQKYERLSTALRDKGQEVRAAALALYPIAQAAVSSSGGSLEIPECLARPADLPTTDRRWAEA